jgi:hypothetical protein
MADKKQAPEVQVWITVDEYEDHPETGELVLKHPAQRVQIVTVNKPAFTGPDGVYHAAVAKSVTPDKWHGMYTIDMKGEWARQECAVMEAAQKKYPNIIGPFDSPIEAIRAKQVARKKTPREAAAEAGTLKETVATQSAEIAELKAKLALIEQKPAGR